jgi:serine/threonine-protein kinase
VTIATPSSTAAPGADRIGQLISGRYRVTSLIGSGGMGAVYVAEHTHMKKRFAVKLLHSEMAQNEEVLARFRREAEAAAHVEHPNIVAATDFGQTEDGAFFLVLEYVDGITLRAKLAEGVFSVDRALYVARQVALALEHAHGAGIVHRDLKPENVMLVTKGDDPNFVKVLDFGVARFDPPSGASGQLLTQAGTVMGTPQYMAPEQAVADRVTHRADLYALGCVLYELLSGHTPFSGDLVELLTKHVTAPVPPISERAPGVIVPPPVEVVVRKLLEKDANDRYPTARALVEAIDQVAMQCGLDAPWAGPSSVRIAVTKAANAPTNVLGQRLTPHEVGVANTVHVDMHRRSAVAAGPLERLAPYLEKVARALASARAALAPHLAAVHDQVDDAAQKIAERFNVSKRVVLGGALGALALVFVLFLTVMLLLRREPHRIDDGVPPKVAAREAKTASPEEIRAAATKGPAALEQLAVSYPNDSAVARELAFAYDAAGRGSDALRVVRLMLDADPNGVPRDLLRIVMRAAAKLETADEAFRLLEGPLGSDGIDALFEIAESREVPSSTSARAQRSLAKPSVRANASPASAFLIDLSTAPSCDDRHDVLVRSGANADARALPVLHALETKHGCGRRQRFDCNPCLRKDDALSRALESAQSRAAQ